MSEWTWSEVLCTAMWSTVCSLFRRLWSVITTGPYTMLVKLYAKDNEQLMDLINGQLQSIPGVVSTETLISLEESVHREIPIDIEK